MKSCVTEGRCSFASDSNCQTKSSISLGSVISLGSGSLSVSYEILIVWSEESGVDGSLLRMCSMNVSMNGSSMLLS